MANRLIELFRKERKPKPVDPYIAYTQIRLQSAIANNGLVTPEDEILARRIIQGEARLYLNPDGTVRIEQEDEPRNPLP